MGVINFKAYKPKNKKKLTILILSILIFIAIVVLISMYISDAEYREYFNKYVLRKEVSQDSSNFIELVSEENSSVYSYDRYITVLNKNKLKQYAASGNLENELDINISNPVYSSNNRFLCMGEENGQKIYLISGGNIVWQNDVEGQIIKVNVNKNGYVNVVVTGTSYNNIIITYNQSGKELFRTYLSNTTAIATDISLDNKYLAVAEVDTSGIIINSKIKVISIEKAQTSPTESVVEIYNAETNKLITNIKYQDKNELLCMYDNSVDIIGKDKNEVLKEIGNDNFVDISLKSSVVQAVEKNKGVFSNETDIIITNIQTKNESRYSVGRTIKALKVSNSNIAINLGNEVHFIGSNGWLIKKYVSNNEINNIVLGDSIAGIVYRDKIEIIHI